MITPADSAPTAPPQMPAAAGSGPAAVPHGGPGTAPYDIQAPLANIAPGYAAGASVLQGGTGGALGSPNVNPYEAGSPDPVMVGGDSDPGGRDDVAGAVAAAVAAQTARQAELQGDTYGQGSVIGDLLPLPGEVLGGFYDPPRDYGGSQ